MTFFRLFLLVAFLFSLTAEAKDKKRKPKDTPFVSKVWSADNGDGTYTNPILYADYSDPDVCRKGKDYYLTASSFNCIPGLPILHSNDLVNWRLINYALPKQEPFEFYSKAQHGRGVWAPSIRVRKDTFYITWGDPDFGLWMVKTTDPAGEWSNPVLMKEAKGAGLEDCCPLWDDDGNTYLSHAYAGSRSGLKSVIAVCSASESLTETGDSRIVYDGHFSNPTIEGTKFYKHNGYYYIFAPAGGVKTGWQTVLRSKSPWGPYEERRVLDQGDTDVNGPHQGAWVTTPQGEDWFLHFQDVYTVGRIVHLQPMRWINDWPVIGEDKDFDGCGQPVKTFRKPDTPTSNKKKKKKGFPIETPRDDDEFNATSLSLQWQWYANSRPIYFFADSTHGVLRLYSVFTDSTRNLWDSPTILAEKLTGPNFTATTKVYLYPDSIRTGEHFSFVIMGEDYAMIDIVNQGKNFALRQVTCTQARKGSSEKINEQILIPATKDPIYLRMSFSNGKDCQFFYSLDNTTFTPIGGPFAAKAGRWIGAKIGYVARRFQKTNDGGCLAIDWIRFTK